MKRLYQFLYSVGMLLTFAACQQDAMESTSQVEEEVPRFICTNDAMVSVSAETRAASTVYQGGNENMGVSITESLWQRNDDETLSRGGITGDELDWIKPKEAEEQIAVYIVKNPPADMEKIVFEKTYSNMGYDPYTRLIRPWVEWENKSQLKYTDVDEYIQGLFNDEVKTLSFFGYTIRPADARGTGGGVDYQATSVVSKIQEDRLTSREVAFTFTPFAGGQTDENIYYHDLMYCTGEEINPSSGRYGNLNMPPRKSIQMHFRHAFSLLNFTIDRGIYQGTCRISELKVNGTLVYDEGVIDLITGEVKPNKSSESTGGKTIKRVFTPVEIGENTPFRTGMIVIPVTIPADAADNAFVITCKIDGIDYSCALKGVKLKSGFKYDVNLRINPPGLTILNLWHGLGQAEVSGGTSATFTNQGIQPIKSELGTTLKITPAQGYQLSQVRRNKELVTVNADNTLTLKYAEKGENVTYDIIFLPEGGDKWYVAPKDMIIHFDGLWNDRYNGLEGKPYTDAKTVTQKYVSYWHDLSGNGNDGQLNSFNQLGTSITNKIMDQTENANDNNTAWQNAKALYESFSVSGWDKYGLKFDGMDDVVSFTSDINGSFTMEFYVCIENVQRGQHPRLNAEPNSAWGHYPSFYIEGIGNYGGRKLFYPSRSIGLYGMGMDTRPWTIKPNGKDIFQYDFVFNGKTINFYCNGEKVGNDLTPNILQPVVTAYTSSIGNRIVDNSRGLNATYYSYILYNRALTLDEIKHNLQVNKNRYGTTKVKEGE